MRGRQPVRYPAEAQQDLPSTVEMSQRFEPEEKGPNPVDHDRSCRGKLLGAFARRPMQVVEKRADCQSVRRGRTRYRDHLTGWPDEGEQPDFRWHAGQGQRREDCTGVHGGDELQCDFEVVDLIVNLWFEAG